jgi:hypothetical protein
MTDEHMRPNDEELLLAAFRAACEGPFFPDWEFATLMSFTRDDLRTLAARWPVVADENQLDLAINSVIGNLTGYPHGRTDELRRFIDSEPSVLAELLQRWRAGNSPLPHSLSLMVASGWEDQPLEQAIETYFRDIEILGKTTVPGTDSTQALDDAGDDGGLVLWLTQAVNSGRPGEAEQAWPIILELVARAPSDVALGMIGAGPLEDLARRHGSRFALHLLERTASDPRFRLAMRHVWFIESPDWPRERLEALRGAPA